MSRVAIITPTLDRQGGTEVYLERLLRVHAARGEATTVFTQDEQSDDAHVVACGAKLSEGMNPLRVAARAGAVAALSDRLAEFDRVEFHRLAPLDLILRLRGRVATLLFNHTCELTCPALGRWLPRSSRSCERNPGLGCLNVDAFEGCLRTPAGEPFRPAQRLRVFSRAPLSRATAQAVSAVVFNSAANRDLFARTTGAAMRAFVLPPPHELPPRTQRARVPRRLAYVGRLQRGKGILDAIRAAALIPDAELHVYGSGEDEAAARELADRLGAAVTFHGWVGADAVAEALAQASCLLFPSLAFEAWGMTGPEAIAAGCPVAAYDVGGVREWLAPEHGTLVKPGDVRALADAAATLMAARPDTTGWQAQADASWGMEAFAKRYDQVVRAAALPRPKVVQVLRHPVPGLHSIEALFETVRDAMPPDVRPAVAVCPHPSRGIVPRLRALRWARALPFEAVHVTGDVHFLALGLPSNRTALTVHDCVILAQRGGLRRALLRKLWFQLPARRAEVVTAISENTRAELARIAGADSAKLHLIPNCVAAAFKPTSRDFKLPATVLLVGTMPHKNLERTVAALAGLPVTLHLIGTPNPAQLTALEASGLPWRASAGLSTERMAAAYADCDLVVFASLSEGFGMPIVEAQASGRPVVTSDREPMRSVAGEGALLADPESAESIRTAVERILHDAELRADLVSKGLTNAKAYTPEAAAQAYLRLYEQLTRA